MLSRNHNQGMRQHLLANKPLLRAFTGNTYILFVKKHTEYIYSSAQLWIVQHGVILCNLKLGEGRGRVKAL